MGQRREDKDCGEEDILKLLNEMSIGGGRSGELLEMLILLL